jgi:hypothetical protein
MMPSPDTWGGVMLARMDRWSERRHHLPGPDQPFPRKVLFGIFVWNFPILFAAIGALTALFYRVDPDASGTGMFTPLNWIVEVLLVALILATVLDLGTCLWLRRLWNRRARFLRQD